MDRGAFSTSVVKHEIRMRSRARHKVGTNLPLCLPPGPPGVIIKVYIVISISSTHVYTHPSSNIHSPQHVHSDCGRSEMR